MKFSFYIVCISFLFFSCGQNKKEVQIKLEEQQVEQAVIERKIDADSLFCEKIMLAILDESANWPVIYVFEKQDWLIKGNTFRIDFDIIPYVQKEVHFYTKDSKNAFSKIEVDYYLLDSEEIAKKIIEGYFYDRNNIENMSDTVFYSKAYIKIPTFLYRRSSTIFHLRTDNGVAHIVANALSDFNEQENIDKNDAVPYIEPRKKKNKK